MKKLVLLCSLLLTSTSCFKKEKSEDPVLNPEQALQKFQTEEGFDISQVATEPMVVDPVGLSFSTDGSVYVAEMKGYMPNIDAVGEDVPTGTIKKLKDKDGDGIFDTSTTFASGLILPRAVLSYQDGVLVGAPPHLYFLQDLDGDGVSDKKTLLYDDFVQSEPEYGGNSPMLGIDGWVYFSFYAYRIKKTENGWLKEPTSRAGQWGLAQNSKGDLFYSTNSKILLYDAFPSHLLFKNKNYKPKRLINIAATDDNSVFPQKGHKTLVNRGYKEGILNKEGQLKNATAACGATIYYSTAFPEKYHDGSFTMEPAANLVTFRKINWKETRYQASRIDKAGFLTSSDPRFRPVNSYVAPDGSLLIVDMYRGVIQHRNHLSDDMYKKIQEQGLAKLGIGQGRIYAVSYGESKAKRFPNLKKWNDDKLLEALKKENLTLRLLAQAEITKRGQQLEKSLKTLMTSDGTSIETKTHAAWILNSWNKLDSSVFNHLINGPNQNEQELALKLIGDKPNLSYVDLVQSFSPKTKKLKALKALVLSTVFGGDIDSIFKEFKKLITGEKDKEFRADLYEAALSQVENLEDKFLVQLLTSNLSGETKKEFASFFFKSFENDHRILRASFLQMEKQRKRIGNSLLLAIAGSHEKRRKVYLEKKLSFDAEVSALLEKNLITYTKAEKGLLVRKDHIEMVAKGKKVYQRACMACHGPSGEGVNQLAPPLVNSEWVIGQPGKYGDSQADQRNAELDAYVSLILITTFGLEGPITVNGKEYNFASGMPPVHLSIEERHQVLSYIRHAWGHAILPERTKWINRLFERQFREKRKPVTQEVLKDKNHRFSSLFTR